MRTPRRSIGFQCNLIHEQTILSPTSCLKKYDLFLSFLPCITFVQYGERGGGVQYRVIIS